MVHAATQTDHHVKRRLLLDVVVRERAPVLELLARKDEPLVVGGDALLVLDLALHHVDGVARLHAEIDGLARQRPDKQLACPRAQVKRRLLLDVVAGERAAVLELLALED